jgi:hypothetical protein
VILEKASGRGGEIVGDVNDDGKHSVYGFSAADLVAAMMAELPPDYVVGVTADAPLMLDGDEERVAAAVRAAIDEGSVTMAADLKRNMPRTLARHRADRIGFEARLYSRWLEALDLYEAILIATREIGEEFTGAHHPQALAEEDLVFGVLARLHARACETASEILALLKSGHASGAHARWRTLHEVTVTAYFVAQHGQQVAERYVLHETVEELKAARNYERCQPRLASHGYEPLDPGDLPALETEVAPLKDRFGDNFKENYGWASAALEIARPTFAQIEAAVELDHIRAHYQMASHPVHAGSKGLSFNLGKSPRTTMLLTGGSNYGLADPGHAALVSLLQCTERFVTCRVPEPLLLVGLKALMQLEKEAGEAFVRIQHELREEEEALALRDAEAGNSAPF